MDNKIALLRGEIDEVDEELTDLFCRRMALSAAIGERKEELGLPVFVPEREASVVQRAAERAGAELAPYARALYREILTLSRACQQGLVPGDAHE